MKEAKFYRKTDSNNLKCTLCPHECSIKNGQYGLCKVRKNIEGKLYSLNYAKISALAMDPVEKKPLYHYYPGSNILSVGTYGCNFKCSFCQNWQISQNKPPLKDIRPEELVEIAKNRNSIGIAYTYSEPSVWYEFVYETAKLARKRNLKNVLITNGFINKKALVDLLPYIDAVNVDLKAFNDEFYHEQAVGQLQPVLDNIKYIYDKIHLEVTTLLIPGLNDDNKELNKLFKWLADCNPDIPLHLSRYFPNYKLEIEKTSLEKMYEAYNLAKKYLNYVYLGNVVSSDKSDTKCPYCGTTVIKRTAYKIENKLKGKNCPNCGKEIAGVFKT